MVRMQRRVPSIKHNQPIDCNGLCNRNRNKSARPALTMASTKPLSRFAEFSLSANPDEAIQNNLMNHTILIITFRVSSSKPSFDVIALVGDKRARSISSTFEWLHNRHRTARDSHKMLRFLAFLDNNFDSSCCHFHFSFFGAPISVFVG